MAGGQGSGGRGNRPFTGGLGNQMGGGPAYGQQQRTGPVMPAQATYQQQQAPYQGGFTPGAPGAQMMQAGQATPFQMNGGGMQFPAGNFTLPGMLRGNQQGNSWYGMNPSQMRPPPKRPVPGQPAAPAVTPPVTDPVTGQPVAADPAATPNPYLGMASDVYGHVVGEDDGTGTGTVTPDPVTGAPRSRHSALAQQIAGLRDLMAERRANTLGQGMGAIGGPGDPRYAAMQQQMRALWAQRGKGNGNPGGGPKNAPV